MFSGICTLKIDAIPEYSFASSKATLKNNNGNNDDLSPSDEELRIARQRSLTIFSRRVGQSGNKNKEPQMHQFERKKASNYTALKVTKAHFQDDNKSEKEVYLI